MDNKLPHTNGVQSKETKMLEFENETSQQRFRVKCLDEVTKKSGDLEMSKEDPYPANGVSVAGDKMSSGSTTLVSNFKSNEASVKVKFKFQRTQFYNSLRNSFLVSSRARIFTKLMKSQVGGYEAERLRHLNSFPETIHPFGDFRWTWDIFMTLTLIVTLITLPIQIAFYSASVSGITSIALNAVAGVIFLIDIFLNIRTGFIGKDSDLVVLDSKITAFHYIKTWFLVDLLSTIPFDLIYLAIDSLIEGNTHTYFKYFRLLELLKILRLARVVRYLSKVQEAYDIKPLYGRVINLVTMMFFVIHWLSCMHYLVADFVHGTSHVKGDQSWVTQMDLWDSPVWVKYLHCALRALSNMGCLGYGYTNPLAPEDVICTMISILIGATWFALFIANISNIVLSLDAPHKKYDETLGHVMDYMKFKHMPKELQERVEFYFEQRYRHNLFNEEEILTNLSSVLRSQLQMFNCQRLVQQVPMLRGVRVEILQEIVAALKAEVYLPRDVIVWENTVGESMYFIQRGTVDILTTSGKVIGQLHDGNFFGEMALLTNEQRRLATVVATSRCDLYSLHRQDFERVVRMYPEVFEDVLVAAQDRARKITMEQAQSISHSHETVRIEGERPERISLQEVMNQFGKQSEKSPVQPIATEGIQNIPTLRNEQVVIQKSKPDEPRRSGKQMALRQLSMESDIESATEKIFKPRPIRVSLDEILNRKAGEMNISRTDSAQSMSAVSLEKRTETKSGKRPLRTSLQELMKLDLSHLRNQEDTKTSTIDNQDILKN